MGRSAPIAAERLRLMSSLWTTSVLGGARRLTTAPTTWSWPAFPATRRKPTPPSSPSCCNSARAGSTCFTTATISPIRWRIWRGKRPRGLCWMH